VDWRKVVPVKSSRIPDGWEYWTTETHGEGAAWSLAVKLKQRREQLRPGVFVRVRVVRAGGAHWILRREETKEIAA
jgi:hypothetical protein